MVSMDNFLGEYDMAVSIRRFGFRGLDEAEEEDSLYPSLELPGFVANFHRTKNN